MVTLNRLPRIKSKVKKRKGRGYSSGQGGHTVGRGAKGDKARGKVPITFEGTKVKKSLIRRLPFRRGKNKFKSLKTKPIVINLEALNLFSAKSVVTKDLLLKKGVVHKKEVAQSGVKILGGGNIRVPLTVVLPCSHLAVEKIQKAGGKVVSPSEFEGSKPPSKKRLRKDSRGSMKKEGKK